MFSLHSMHKLKSTRQRKLDKISIKKDVTKIYSKTELTNKTKLYK